MLVSHVHVHVYTATCVVVLTELALVLKDHHKNQTAP